MQLLSQVKETFRETVKASGKNWDIDIVNVNNEDSDDCGDLIVISTDGGFRQVEMVYVELSIYDGVRFNYVGSIFCHGDMAALVEKIDNCFSEKIARRAGADSDYIITDATDADNAADDNDNDAASVSSMPGLVTVAETLDYEQRKARRIREFNEKFGEPVLMTTPETEPEPKTEPESKAESEPEPPVAETYPKSDEEIRRFLEKEIHRTVSVFYAQVPDSDDFGYLVTNICGITAKFFFVVPTKKNYKIIRLTQWDGYRVFAEVVELQHVANILSEIFE